MNLQRVAHEALLAHLRDAGLTPTSEPARVRLGLGELSAWCDVGEAARHPNVHLVPVWISLGLDGGGVIQESFAGLGESSSQAVTNAVHQWAEGVLPPIRRLYEPPGSRPEPGFTLTSYADGSDCAVVWEVFDGPYQVMGGREEALLSRIEEQEPFTLVVDAVTVHLREERLHWVKLFLMRQPDGRVEGEVRINNEVSEAGFRELSQFRWPAGEGYAYLRQFLVLRPGGRERGETKAPLGEQLAAAQRQWEGGVKGWDVPKA